MYADPNTRIEQILDGIISNLNLRSISEFKNEEKIWIKQFHDNWLFNLGLLLRLDPCRLPRLDLPLLLEDELEKIIVENGKSQKNSKNCEIDGKEDEFEKNIALNGKSQKNSKNYEIGKEDEFEKINVPNGKSAHYSKNSEIDGKREKYNTFDRKNQHSKHNSAGETKNTGDTKNTYFKNFSTGEIKNSGDIKNTYFKNSTGEIRNTGDTYFKNKSTGDIKNSKNNNTGEVKNTELKNSNIPHSKNNNIIDVPIPYSKNNNILETKNTELKNDVHIPHSKNNNPEDMKNTGSKNSSTIDLQIQHSKNNNPEDMKNTGSKNSSTIDLHSKNNNPEETKNPHSKNSNTGDPKNPDSKNNNTIDVHIPHSKNNNPEETKNTHSKNNNPEETKNTNSKNYNTSHTKSMYPKTLSTCNVDHSRDNQKFSLKLSSEQKDVLRATWTKLYTNKFGIISFVHTFYEIFFYMAPDAKRLFDEEDLEWQSKVLSNMIHWVVDNLDNTAQLVPVLAQMGGRHEIYGVHKEYYLLFSSAVAKTFEKILTSKIITPVVYKVWEDTLNEISELMMEAARVTKKGFRQELLRENKSGAWSTIYVSLTLDTLYLFKDESYTQLRAQYTLQGVEALVVVDEPNGIDFCFSLKSENPPFLIRLGTTDEKIFEEWLQEIDWRLQAIHRVFNQKDEDTSGEQHSPTHTHTGGCSPRLTSRTPTSTPILKHNHYHSVKTTKKIKQKKSRLDHRAIHLDTLSTPSNSLNFSHPEITLTERQKMLINLSWGKILIKKFDSHGCQISAITQVFDEFYKLFFEVNPAGKRLFQNVSIACQSRALVRMIAMIVKGMENSPELYESIINLGGRHLIYGVEATDYVAFSNAMCTTFESVLGKEDCDAETKDAWYKVMMELSSMMLAAGSKIKKEALSTVIWRKLTRLSQWKKSYIELTIDTLFVYRDEKNTKLRSSYPLSEISDIELSDERVSDPPTQFGFILHLVTTKPPEIFFCTESDEEMKEWMSQLNWRIQAIQRVYEEPGEEEDLMEIEKISTKSESGIMKAIGKYKKKKEKSLSNSPQIDHKNK